MRKLKLFFACLLMAVFSIGQMWAAEELKVTLDFTNAASDWGIPTSLTMTTNSYTHGGYTISLYGGTVSKKGYKANNGYLLMGQSNASLTFPAFTWKTTRIVVSGHDGASTNVKQNIYVGNVRDVQTARLYRANTAFGRLAMCRGHIREGELFA